MNLGWPWGNLRFIGGTGRDGLKSDGREWAKDSGDGLGGRMQAGWPMSLDYIQVQAHRPSVPFATYTTVVPRIV